MKPRVSIPNYSDKYELIRKPLFVETPIGKININDFEQYIGKGDVLPFGTYLGYDDVIGNIILMHRPEFTTSVKRDLDECIQLLFSGSVSIVKEKIQTQSHVKWLLIERILKTCNLQDMTEDALSSFKDLLAQLVAEGAEYKYLLHIHSKEVDSRIIQACLTVFGDDVLVASHAQLNVFNLFGDAHIWDKVKLYLSAGADVNQRIDEIYHNTLLHYFLALEIERGAIELINVVEKHHRTHPTSSTIDYTVADKFGKTPLLMAVGLGLNVFVNTLIAKRSTVDIGLDTPDALGRTPVMIAAALGRYELLNQLILAGADLSKRDSEGLDVHAYAGAPDSLVAEILQQYSIHPERSSCAYNQSYLYSELQTAIPWVLRDKSSGEEQMIVMSGKPEGLRRINIAKALVKTAKEREVIDMQLRFLSPANADVSMAEACVQNHKKVKKVLNAVLSRVEPMSVFSDTHTQLLRELNVYRRIVPKAFFEAIDAKNYAQAVRRIVSFDSDKASALLAVLLKHKDALKIDLNERAGANQMTALHWASKTTTACYTMLLEAGADPTVPNAEGVTPQMLRASLSISPSNV